MWAALSLLLALAVGITVAGIVWEWLLQADTTVDLAPDEDLPPVEDPYLQWLEDQWSR